MDDVVAGCLSPSQNHCRDAHTLPPSPSASVNSKIGKSKLTKEGQSTSSALKKFLPQIRKPPRRKTSPVNWFPRKKVDSYLERKIKMLQEVDGVSLTLDQTLGNSNPHYSRVLREKMAVREAAHKAMEARRAALVEASWCRILRAAGIPCDDAEAQLIKAEKSANGAFEAAQAMGVIMFDLPDCPRKYCQIETPSLTGEGSSTHTFTASFETAFDVDKEVAAAVKTAFIRLAHCPSFSSKDEFKELLKKISENPDADESHQDLSEFSSEYESESGSELKSTSQKSDSKPEDLDSKKLFWGVSQKKTRKRQSLENRVKLVDMMIERLKCLQEDGLSSLATIVATYGLNAALAEVQNIKQQNQNPGSASEYTSSSAINFPARRMSSLGLGNSALDAKMRKKQVESELPSLDKFLVKHMTKLEREISEAKKNRRNETESCKSFVGTPSETIPDLGSILVKKNYTKLEKDIEEAKIGLGKEVLGAPRCKPNSQKDHTEVPSLDKILVKHVSRLEKEVQEAKKRTINENKSLSSGRMSSTFYFDEALDSKENINLNTQNNNSVSSEIEENKGGLEKILIKPVHRLEKEKMHALSQGSRVENYRQMKNQGAINVADCESLDKVLVKHVSRLEKEKMRIKSRDEWGEVKRSHGNNCLDTNEGDGGLDQVLVKHKSRLEREKIDAAAQQPENPVSRSMTRREVRERELQETWGGLSLGNSIKPSLSRLERDKAAWIKAEEEERKQARDVKL